jgi:hypothetical protein
MKFGTFDFGLWHEGQKCEEIFRVDPLYCSVGDS